jgi:5-dehydro-2-deoxygluconokinase
LEGANSLLTFQHNRFLIIGRAGLDLYADPIGTEIENATSFKSALGGSAANIAVSIVKQGGSAALFTAVSSDAVGRYTLNALGKFGVDTRFVKTVGNQARNSLAIVETRAENCQSVIYRNNAADFEISEIDAESIDYSGFAALIVTGTALALEPSRSATFKAMQLARNAGLILVIDVDYRPYSWASHAEAQHVCLKASEMCDIIVGNDEEFSVLAGGQDGLMLAEQLSEKTTRIVVYKMGHKGCITFARDVRFETPIFAVSALKPTGAGDGFMGGFISGLVAGAPLHEAVRRGAATAAIVVTRVGCAPAMPDTNEVQSFMHNNQV